MLDPETAAFIQTGVSISLAGCGADRLPSMSRALGCKLSEDGQELRVFLRRSQSLALLDHVRDNGQVANVFSLPSSNRTLQLKGSDARVTPFDPADRAFIDRHIAEFACEVVPLGMPETLVRTILAYEVDDLVTVAYSPAAAFSQTPGPKAGTPLR